MTDRGPPLVRPRSVGHCTYVDSIGVLGATEATVLSAQNFATLSFAGVGLEVHETVICNAGGEALGARLNGREGCARPTPSRFWRVRGAAQGPLAPASPAF